MEQAAFSPAATVPGIELSADKVLQGRIFVCKDTQMYRLGTNYWQLPTNRPQAVLNEQQEGIMKSGTFSGSINYETNKSARGISEEAPVNPTNMNHVTGEGTLQKIDPTNDFEQAGEKYRSMSTIEQDHLIDNIIDFLGKADKLIREGWWVTSLKQIRNWTCA